MLQPHPKLRRPHVAAGNDRKSRCSVATMTGSSTVAWCWHELHEDRPIEACNIYVCSWVTGHANEQTNTRKSEEFRECTHSFGKLKHVTTSTMTRFVSNVMVELCNKFTQKAMATRKQFTFMCTEIIIKITNFLDIIHRLKLIKDTTFRRLEIIIYLYQRFGPMIRPH
jgi:hypothetical protein